MPKTRMLIVEDDLKLQKMLHDYFVSQDFEVKTLSDGADAVETILTTQPDIIVLDLMLPELDGLAICRQVRSECSGKIMMLTASDDDFDHVAGLEVGADDFVTKPIKPRVLLARVRTLLRRTESQEPEGQTASCLNFGRLSLDNRTKQCHLSGERITMTASDFDLLWLLASHPDTPLSRDFLTKTLRGIEYDGVDRTIDNKIVRLRKLLDTDSPCSERLQTVRGKGYQFVSSAWEHSCQV